MRTSTRLILVLLALALGASVVAASVSFTPPGGKKMYVASMPLQARPAAGKATGTVTMVCQADLTKGMITVQASGLDPKAVYTVWLAKGTKRAGVGKAPHQMKVSAKGFGNLMADLANCKQATTQRVDVLRHAGRNAKDTKGAVVVFTGDLSKLLQK